MKNLEELRADLDRCYAESTCYGRGSLVPFAHGLQPVDDWICPVLDYAGFFSYTPRSKLFLAREVLAGNMQIDEQLVRIFYSCPDCGSCDTLCPLPHLEISRAMKERIAEEGYIPEPNRKLNDNLRQNQNLFGAPNANRARWAKGLQIPKQGKVLYFAGCYHSYRQPETARAVIKILRAAGIDAAFLAGDEWCCGLHAGFSGDRDLEREMANHNIKVIERCGAEKVVFSCPSCYRTFRTDYPQLSNYSFQVMHIVEVLSELLKEGKIEINSKGEQEVTKVTYHDPCHMGKHHLGRGFNLYKAPRDVIMSIPGVEFLEMQRHGLWADCCGGGSSVVSSAYPKVTKYLSQKRLSQVQEDVALLTTCPRCVENLRRSAKDLNRNLVVADLVSFVGERIKG